MLLTALLCLLVALIFGAGVYWIKTHPIFPDDEVIGIALTDAEEGGMVTVAFDPAHWSERIVWRHTWDPPYFEIIWQARMGRDFPYDWNRE